ncbi:MAG: CotH kinase family protein [Planctomycetota bacterium]
MKLRFFRLSTKRAFCLVPLVFVLLIPVFTAFSQSPSPFDAPDVLLLDEFDVDKSGFLEAEERILARKSLVGRAGRDGRGGGPGGGPGFGGPGGGPGFGGPGGGPGFGGPGGGPGFGGPGGGPGFGGPGGGPGFGGPGGGPGFGGPGGGPGFGGPGGGPGFGGPGGGPGFGGPGGGRGFGGRGGGRGRRGPGGPGGGPPGRGQMPASSQGIAIAKDSVAAVSGDFYDPNLVRTVFIDFENDDWEQELEDFHGTDVEVPATLQVDGQSYPNCGVSFRGASSYGMTPAGYRRSLNISVDALDEKQRIGSYKTLNLLNGASDDSLMSTVLYSHIANQFIPAPRSNFVRVVINGHDWGIYTNVEQFNKAFVKRNFGSKKGARWKVSGSPRGGGGLDYRGQNLTRYEYPYEQKSGDESHLSQLVELCRVLEETPTKQLPEALPKICDVENLLWFLALDNALMNSDGYWIRASDYSIVLDKDGIFHFVPHDMNEAFRGAGGGRGGPGGGPRDFGFGFDFESEIFGGLGLGGSPGSSEAESQVGLDPLIGLQDRDKPLRSKVLAVEAYRKSYLEKVRRIADEWLDWEVMGPVVRAHRERIAPYVEVSTRKLGSYEHFMQLTGDVKDDETGKAAGGAPLQRGHGAMNLKQFFDQRREVLMCLTAPNDTAATGDDQE